MPNKRLICHNCGHEWLYTGDSDKYASCPYCHFKTMIKTARKRFLDYSKALRNK